MLINVQVMTVGVEYGAILVKATRGGGTVIGHTVEVEDKNAFAVGALQQVVVALAHLDGSFTIFGASGLECAVAIESTLHIYSTMACGETFIVLHDKDIAPRQPEVVVNG